MSAAVVDAADRAELARKVARLEPLVCIKGCNGARTPAWANDLRLFALDCQPRVWRGGQRAAGHCRSARTRSASSRTASTRRGRSSSVRGCRRLRHPLALRRAGAERERQARPAAASSSARSRTSAAARVTAVVPYLAYARKDRKTKARDPVTTRYVAEPVRGGRHRLRGHARRAQSRGVPERVPLPHRAPGSERAVRRPLRAAAA